MEQLWNKEIISRLFAAAGGKSNIQEIYNCSVRLRLKVINLETVQKETLAAFPDVKDVVYFCNEVQLLIGINAGQIARACKKLFEEK